MRILGIDEAGRGAVIGPLVVGGTCILFENLAYLKNIGVRDSKKLVHKKREEIFESFKKENILFHFFEITPKEIDVESLNDIEITYTIKLIKFFSPEKVFLDVPARGRGIEKYCDKIRKEISKDIEVIGGNKFDDIHRIVGAASIVAKVARERAIERLKKNYGDFGSGYPNARTVEYIKDHYNLMKPIVRMKWKTIKRLKIKSHLRAKRVCREGGISKPQFKT